MRLRAFPFVLIAIVLISMTLIACKAPPEFELSNLVLSKSTLKVNDTISFTVDVENIGGTKGDFTANFSVNGEKLTATVENVRAGKTKQATVTYTPQEAKSYTVTVDGLSGSFTVEEEGPPCPVGTPSAESADWWEFEYEVAGGDIELVVSLMSASLNINTAEFEGGDITLKVSKGNVTDGYRDVMIEQEDWNVNVITVPDIQQGIDMDLALVLTDDCEGKLFVEKDAGDADVTSITDVGGPESTFSGGTEAGGMLISVPLEGQAETNVGQDVNLEMPVRMTTGHSIDTASSAGDAIDGHQMEADGVPFCKNSASVADYVGTKGTLVCTGSSLGLTLIMAVDFQFMISMELEPK